MSLKLPTLTIHFNNEIQSYEIPAFRGAIITALGNDKNVLYHNHTDEGFRYAYPLVQYKRIRKKAAIVCIKEGVEAIGEFFSNANLCVRIGEKEQQLEIETVKPSQILIQIWDDTFKYRVRRWLPLNAKNYPGFMTLEGLAEKVQFLEKVLVGNLLSFAKGIGLNIEQAIICNIITLSEPMLIKNKGIKLMAFDIEFKCNLSLPEFIGVGKNSSIGYGVVSMIRDGK